MLIVYTPISSLDKSKLELLKSIAQQRTQIDSDTVVFEGKYFRLSEIQSLRSGPQLLQG